MTPLDLVKLTPLTAPFMTKAIALLWSEFPIKTVTEVKFAITQASRQWRTMVVPLVVGYVGSLSSHSKD